MFPKCLILSLSTADLVSGCPSKMLGRSLLATLSLLTLAVCHSWYDCIPGITGSIGGKKNIVSDHFFSMFTVINFSQL